MKLVTKRDVICAVPERWDFQYRHSTDEDKLAIGRALRSLTLAATEADVAAVIGNSSWTRLVCAECDRDVDGVIAFQSDTDLSICPRCLKRASVLAESLVP